MQKKIAVIGSGLGGLSVAWLLSQSSSRNVTIFEARDTLGMDSEGFDFQSSDGTVVRVDVPFRVIACAYYTHLFELFKAVGIESETVDFSQSFTKNGPPCFSYRNVHILGFTFTWPTWTSFCSLRFWVMLFNLACLCFQARRSGTVPGGGRVTMEEWFTSRNYDREFVDCVFYPKMATLLTCSSDQVRAYPADIMLRFVAGVFRGAGVRHARGGSKLICERLSAACTVRCGAKVRSVTPVSYGTGGAGVNVTLVNGETARFDACILASQPQQARQLVSRHWCPEALHHFKYTKSIVCVHTDHSLAPPDHSSIQYVLDGDDVTPVTTLLLNRVIPQLKGHDALYQTWYVPGFAPAELLPDPEAILHTSSFERPLMTVDTAAHLGQLHSQQGRGGIFYVGSYSLWDTPFLENALKSGLRVAETIGPMKRPWNVVEQQIFPSFLVACTSVVLAVAVTQLFF